MITVDGYPVGFMYREEPNDVDGGWRFFSGKESQDTWTTLTISRSTYTLPHYLHPPECRPTTGAALRAGPLPRDRGAGADRPLQLLDLPKKGFLHLIVPPEQFELLAGREDLTCTSSTPGPRNTSSAATAASTRSTCRVRTPTRSTSTSVAWKASTSDGLTIDPFDGTNWEQAIGSASWKVGGPEWTSAARTRVAGGGRADRGVERRADRTLSRGGRESLRARRRRVAEGRGAFVVARVDGKPGGLRGDSPDRRRDRRDQAHVRGAFLSWAGNRRARARGARGGSAASPAVSHRARDRRAPARGARRSTGGPATRGIPAFGEYVGKPLSVCMEKRLAG